MLRYVEGSKNQTLSITAVLDNTRPVLSKTFQDFGFSFEVNKPLLYHPILACQKRRQQLAEAAKLNVGGNELTHIHVSSRFGNYIGTISPNELRRQKN